MASPATSPHPAADPSRRGRRAIGSGGRAQRARGAPCHRRRPRGTRRPGVRHRHLRREEIAATLGACSDASPDAFTALHDAFLAGGAFVKVPRGVVVERPSWCCTGRRRRAGELPAHAGRGGGERRVTVFDRYGSTDTGPGSTGHLVDAVVELVVGDNAHVRYLSVQEHGPRTWQIALQRAHLGRDASLKSSVVALGGAYARLRSESLLAGSGAESDLTAVYFGDGDQMLDFRTLQDHDAPNTRSDLLFKARSRTPRSPSTRGSSASATTRRSRWRSRPTATSCSPRRGGEVGAQPRDRGRRREVLARQHRRAGRRDALYYLATRGWPPEEAERLIVLGFFDDVFDRLPVPSLVAPLRRSVSRSSSTATRSRGPVPDVRVCAVADVKPAPRALRCRRSSAVRGERRRHVLRDRRRVLPRRLLALRGRRVGGRGEIELPRARIDLLAAHRRAPDAPCDPAGAGVRTCASTANDVIVTTRDRTGVGTRGQTPRGDAGSGVVA